MKKLLFIFAFFAIAGTVEAQSKKNPSKVTEIAVATPTMFVEYKGLVLDLYDREGQKDGIDLARTQDIIEGNDPRDPEMTFIAIPELGERAYKFAESLSEVAKEADGITVIKMKFSEMQKSMRTKYN